MSSFHLHTFNPGAGRTGLWLHGWMGSGAEGEALAERLRCTLICPDLPGHGSTPLGDWTIRSVVDRIAFLAAGCAWAGGYSMGARLLMMAAMAQPESFGPLALESGFWGYESADERQARRTLDAERAQDLCSRGVAAFTADWYAASMWGGYRPTPRTGDPAELAGALEQFSSAVMPDLRPWLRTTTSPVLWLAGSRDSAYADRARWMQAHTRHSVVLLRTGHNLHGEDPAGWSRAVRSFLDQPQPEQE
jgi:2-succinyl-6-hydroxy-2,4-cyclohexadiene-1-carboxylate synthase